MASKTVKKEIPEQQQYLSPLQLRILELLKESGSMTRPQICEEFRYGKHQVKVSIYPDKKHPLRKRRKTIEQYDKRTTIYDNLVKLQKRRLIEKHSRNHGKRGRPLVYWKITKITGV